VTRLAAALVACACAVAAGSSCGTGGVRRPRERPVPLPAIDAPGDRPFQEPTPSERARLEALLGRVSAAGADERLEIGRTIARCGPVAVPVLLAALRREDPAVRAHAAYLLGVMRDRRTAEALAEAARDPVPQVRYEASAALLELGDDRGLDGLIEGLSDPDARLRSKSASVLEQRTGQRFGYAADDPPEERERAVRRWRTWRELRRADEGTAGEATR
jgi:hypothetical protein